MQTRAELERCAAIEAPAMPPPITKISKSCCHPILELVAAMCAVSPSSLPSLDGDCARAEVTAPGRLFVDPDACRGGAGV